jgi:predicted Zn finger-like uncharacterized protein
MAFAVVCKSCQARFLLNDDLLRRKVAGRVVTVRCRQCHATIEVDASDVDPKTVPEIEKPAAPKPAPKGLKPTPAPPRPAKSTLMGIGAERPGGATELVALSPGFLNLSAPAPVPNEHGFPEPPPPPGAVEELTSGDWEVTETPPLVVVDVAPESVDDFAEELPPSQPPPDEEMPSSTGTPSLRTLAHHEESAPKPRGDDFLANMSAAMNGGIMAGAPTIDVSTLTAAPAQAEAAQTPSIDLAHLDVSLPGTETQPLFGFSSDDEPTAGATPRTVTGRSRPMAPGEGSLSPAAFDRLPREAQAGESQRERKNVVAPATKSEPPAAVGQRRSGLAAPVLLALAVAAGFLIWKRGAVSQDALPRAEQPATPAVAAPPPPPATPIEAVAVAPLASTATSDPTLADDLTFETTPSPPLTAAPGAATRAKPADAAGPAVEKPIAAVPATEAKPEPAGPAINEAPQAVPPSGDPAGPFDRAAAAAALTAGAAQASACRKDGDPSGVASVVITFAPSGRVTSASISGPPFAGTPTGGCIAAALRKARIPAFEGDRVTVSKTIVVQ